MLPKRFTVLAILGLYLTFGSNAFAENAANEVNEATCEACREKKAKGINDCLACHFCETDSVTVKWHSPLGNIFQSLSLKEARTATLAIEASFPMESPALAALGMAFPPIEGRTSAVSLGSVQLTQKDLQGPYRRDFIIEYRSADLASLAGMEPETLGDFKVTFWICQDTNQNGKCSDEDRRVQAMPKSENFSACKMPRVVLFGPQK